MSRVKKNKDLKDLFKNKFNGIGVFFRDKYFSMYKSFPMFFIFLGTALFNTILLRILSVGNFYYVKPVLADAGMLFLFASFVFLFKSDKGRAKYLLVLSIITSIICIIHSLYYTYYNSFASVSLLATSTFVVDVGDAVVDQVLNIGDFLYLWQPIFMFYCYFKWKKRNKNNSRNSMEHGKTFFVSSVVIGVVLVVFSFAMMSSVEWSRFGKMWNRESVVSSFGIFTYQINDVVQSLQPKISNLFGHDKALKKVKDYYDNVSRTNDDNEYTGIFEGKNVLVIHAESLQTIALEKSFNGQDVAPYLKKIASEGIYFSNYYSEVGVGTSSDAEFTFSTSLMPSSNGTVFVNYFDREYQTIQKAFNQKGYYTFSMHGNTGDFWNRATMHKNMGYQKFYSKSSFDIDEVIGLGISDKSFFEQAILKIKEINAENKLFYGTLITLTNHTPWSDLDLMDEFDTSIKVDIDGEEVVRDYLNGTTLGNYFRSVHYMDQAIELFIEGLDKEGILDNTVIVIYGDHDARISSRDYNLMYNYDAKSDSLLEEGDENYLDYNSYLYKLDKKVPFIIWTKDGKYQTEVKTATGMIDAYPILENLFRLDWNQYQLGHDVLGNGLEDNVVPFTDGSYVTSKIYYNGQNGGIYSIEGEAISEDYVQQNSLDANNRIDISNDIITYDLIKEINSKKEE